MKSARQLRTDKYKETKWSDGGLNTLHHFELSYIIQPTCENKRIFLFFTGKTCPAQFIKEEYLSKSEVNEAKLHFTLAG